MKKVIVLMLFVLAVSGLMMAQNWSSTVDVLGAHNNQGRGCAGCHAPHSGSFGSGHGGAPMPVAMHCGDRTPARSMAKPSLSATAENTLKRCPPTSPAAALKSAAFCSASAAMMGT